MNRRVKVVRCEKTCCPQCRRVYAAAQLEKELRLYGRCEDCYADYAYESLPPRAPLSETEFRVSPSLYEDLNCD